MFKFKTLATSMVLAMAFAFVIMPLSQARAEGGSDVFVDEGDGDFDATPIPAKGAKGEVAHHEDAVPQAHDDAAPVAQAPADSEAKLPDANPDELVPPTQATTDTPSSHDDDKTVVDQPEKKKKKKKKKHDDTADAGDEAVHHDAPVAHEHHKSHADHGGMFVVTKSACPMTREPASDSEQMILVKPSRKIWVEKVDGSWVKGFNKAGEPGYISTDCVN